MADTTARIGGLSFRGGEGLKGFFLDLDDGFIGWDDGVDTRREEIAIPNAHGDYDFPGYRGPRLVVFTGDCLTESPEEQQAHQRKLMGLLADGGKSRLRVEHQGSNLWADVRLAGDPKFKVKIYGTVARYQISFLAADPRKYGQTRSFGPIGAGDLVLYHRGNFQASAVATVTGTFSADFAIYYAGRPFRVSRDVTPGHPLTINLGDGRLYQDNVRVLGGVTLANTFTVPPGPPSTISFDPNGGSGTLKVDVVDTNV